MYRIVQIFYDDNTLKQCYINSHVALYYNPIPSAYFENSIIVEAKHILKEYDYFGVWSWKHKSKIQGKGFDFNEFEKRFQQTDVFAFQRFLRNGRIFSGQQEQQYQRLFNNLMEELNIKYRFPNRPKFIVMQNHFIARKDVLSDYILTVLEPAINFMETDKAYDQVVNYRGSAKTYTYKPFICEKLFSAYLSDKNLICEHW